MSRRSARVLCLALLCACTSATARERAHERTPPRELRHLDEALAIGEHSCVIESARERVTEARRTSDRRPSADLRVLELSFRCRTASDRPISFEQALPKDALVLLVDSEGATKAPSTRTFLHTVVPEHVLFELDENEHALPRPRRYDTRTGALKASAAPTRSFELWLSGTGLSTRVRFTKALDEVALERSLDALVENLATTHGSELQELRTLHRATIDQTHARTLQIDEVTAEGPLRIVVASYRDQARPLGREPARLVLELAPTGRPDAPYEFSRARDLSTLRTLLRCGAKEQKVEAAARKAFSESPKQTLECNAAGVLWPAPCDAIPPDALGEALEARSGCMGEAIMQLEKRAQPVPSDLQITVRRGRGKSALDRSPRYTLALFSSGATVFHAQQRAGALERRDGRTPRALIGALMRAVEDLAWFDRRGGGWGEDCDPHADDAHVLTVHARERERMVVDREGCRGPFSARELSELFAVIEQVSFVSTFTMPRPQYADRDARIWTIDAE